ncbi:MAG: lipopolysaccharide kinase InaA family protein [Phycisphaerae bacterium]
MLHVQPDWQALLEANALESFDALFAAAESGVVDGHQERSVSRVELRGTDGRPVVLYLKRRWGRAAKRHWADLVRLQWPRRPLAAEWDNLMKLRAAGVALAEPVAVGRDDSPRLPRALLAVREVRGVSLARWLADFGATGGPSPSYDVATVARAVGLAVRRLHDAGYSFPDLYAKHLFLEDAGAEGPRVVLIDPARLRRWTRGRAAADWAALAATAESPSMTCEERSLALRAYFPDAAPLPDVERFARRVKHLARRLAGRGRDPHLIPARRCAPPGMVPLAEEKFAVLDGGRLRINEAFRPALEATGLATLDALMAFEGGQAYRTVPGRWTVRAEIPRPGGGAQVVLYLKRHNRVPWPTGLRRTVSLGDPISLADQEARNIVRLTDAGIASARCVAVGWEFSRGGRRERSCLVTEEVPGAVQADTYCERAFAPPRRREATDEKRRFVRALGRLARQFHGAGFAHRDFYLCHVLVRPVEGAEPALHLIDLQRLLRFRRRVPTRWIVKDLAALLFSSWPSEATLIRSEVFTDTDRMRFAREYFGVGRLSAGEKGLLRRAIRKARRIARREARRRVDRP